MLCRDVARLLVRDLRLSNLMKQTMLLRYIQGLFLGLLGKALTITLITLHIKSAGPA